MFHLSTEMQIQLLCFAALVIVCIAGTRLIYHDGIVGDIRRLKWHCQMQAALILILCGWAWSIGFRINESCVAIIKEQSEVIEQLQAMRGSSVGNQMASAQEKGISNANGTNEDSSQPSIASGEIRTPAGHVVTYSIANESADANDRSVSGIGSGERWRFGGYRQRDYGTPGGIDGRDFTTAGDRRMPFASPSLSDLR